jgi:hypothetical protein
MRQEHLRSQLVWAT